MISNIFDLDDKAADATLGAGQSIPDPYIPEISQVGTGRTEPFEGPVISFDVAARTVSTMDTLRPKDVPIITLTISDLAGAELRKVEVPAPEFGNVNGPIDRTIWHNMDTQGLPAGMYRLTVFAQWGLAAIFGKYLVVGGGAVVRVGGQVAWANTYPPTRERPNDNITETFLIQLSASTDRA